MDDLYPIMNTSTSYAFTIDEYTLYAVAVISLIMVCRCVFIKEGPRVYRITKRKNTEDSPVVDV